MQDAGAQQEHPHLRRPRVVFLGKSSVETDPQPFLREKYRLLAEHLDVTMIQLGCGGRHDVEGVLIRPMRVRGPKALTSLSYYVLGPVLALREAGRRPPAAVVCQSPLEAAPLLAVRALLPRRTRPRVVVEVHGDWRTATRLYGSRHRRLLTPLVDRLAVLALRRADRVRAVGEHTRRLASESGYRGDLVVYPAWSDYAQVTREPPVPLPERPVVLYVGALEPTKGVDVLLEAWPAVRAALPEARLVLVGDGSLRGQVDQAMREQGEGVRALGRVPRSEVAGRLDAATLLVLPSRSEGLPLVLLEAMARARAVVASRVGGIPELVEDGASGLLVPPADPGALGQALLRLLRDPERCAQLGEAGRRCFLERDPAQAHADGVRELAAWISGDARAVGS